MTKIDKKIINLLLVICCAIFVYGIIFQLPITLKVIAVLGGIFYFAFLVFHLALCFPLYVVISETNDLIENTLFFIKIKEKSEIVYKLILIVICIIVVGIVYYAIPILLCMAFNNSFNFNAASNLLGGALGRDL